MHIEQFCTRVLSDVPRRRMRQRTKMKMGASQSMVMPKDPESGATVV